MPDRVTGGGGFAQRLPFFYGWVVVAVAFVTMAIGVNARTAFSLLFPPILAEFGWERGITASAFSLGFIASILYAPFLGMLMDRFGPRWVISLGVCLVAAGMATAPLIRQPWHLHATLGLLVGGGSMLMTYSGHSLFLPNWFARKRGLALGLAFSGVGVGSILIFPWLQRMIGSTGWRDACLSLAVLLVVILLPLNLLLQRQRPEDLGLNPDGDPDRAAARGAAGDNVVDREWASTEWTVRRAIRTARFWWVFVAFFSSLFAWYAVQVHQTKYLIEIGFDATMAAYALGLVGFAGIGGQIALGYFSDRVGREWAWTLGCLGFAASYALLLAMREHPTPGLLYLMVAAQGLFGYGLASVFGAIPAEIFQGKRYATIFGTLNLATGAGAGVGPWVAGAVYDHVGSYAPAFWSGILLSFVAVFAIWFAAPRRVRVVAGQVARLHERRARLNPTTTS